MSSEKDREQLDFPPADEGRVSLGDPQQVRDWASKLGVSPEHLRELVAQVGPRVSDLKQRLSQPEVLD